MSTFRFSVLSFSDKKKFLFHMLIVTVLMVIMTYIAVSRTNPVLYTSEEKISVSIGVMIGVVVLFLSIFNLIKSIAKVKFLTFLIIWLLLMSLQFIMSTLIWVIGLNVIPLIFYDILIMPYWKKVWYNNYER